MLNERSPGGALFPFLFAPLLFLEPVDALRRGVLPVRDLETGQSIQVDPAYARDEYVAQIRSFIESYRRACAEARIDYVSADTSTPYDFMLSRYVAKRGRP